jgi:hypothetical protein
MELVSLKRQLTRGPDLWGSWYRSLFHRTLEVPHGSQEGPQGTGTSTSPSVQSAIDLLILGVGCAQSLRHSWCDSQSVYKRFEFVCGWVCGTWVWTHPQWVHTCKASYVKSRCSTAWDAFPVHFAVVILEIGARGRVSQAVCPACTQTMILSISTSQVASCTWLNFVFFKCRTFQ